MYDMAECKYVQLLIEFEDVVQCLLIYMSLWCLFIDPHQLHTIEYRSPIKKGHQLTLYSFEVM